MKAWITFWNILAKDMRSYYLKPPNIRYSKDSKGVGSL